MKVISETLLVRRATMDDADIIRDLTKQLVDCRGKLFSEERFMFGMKKRIHPTNKRHHFFVCTLDGKVVGMTLAELIPTCKTEAYLNILFVDKDHFRQGIGKKLFYFIMSYLKDLAIETVFINVRKNPMDLSFFAKFGFKKDYELKPFTCMVKELK